MTWDELGLEVVCPQCQGNKMHEIPDMVTGGKRQVICDICYAPAIGPTGKVASPLGKELLAFIRRNRQ